MGEQLIEEEVPENQIEDQPQPQQGVNDFGEFIMSQSVNSPCLLYQVHVNGDFASDHNHDHNMTSTQIYLN